MLDSCDRFLEDDDDDVCGRTSASRGAGSSAGGIAMDITAVCEVKAALRTEDLPVRDIGSTIDAWPDRIAAGEPSVEFSTNLLSAVAVPGLTIPMEEVCSCAEK
jgi:hypothetical protein